MLSLSPGGPNAFHCHTGDGSRQGGGGWVVHWATLYAICHVGKQVLCGKDSSVTHPTGKKSVSPALQCPGSSRNITTILLDLGDAQDLGPSGTLNRQTVVLISPILYCVPLDPYLLQGS